MCLAFSPSRRLLCLSSQAGTAWHAPGCLARVAAGWSPLVAHLGYGAFRLYVDPPKEGDATVTVRLVQQPSIDQSQKMENTDRIGIFEKLWRSLPQRRKRAASGRT